MKNFIKNSLHSQKVFYRYFRKKGLRRFIKENILESDGSNETKAKSIALGVFIGLSPFWGLHFVLAVFLSTVFKLNKVLTFMFTNISLPPLIPFIIYGSIKIGEFFIGGNALDFSQKITMETIKSNLLQYTVGSLILSAVCAVLIGVFSYFIMQKTTSSK